VFEDGPPQKAQAPAATVERADQLLDSRFKSIDVREVLLDRGHDPPLLVQRRQRNRPRGETRRTDVMDADAW
jgi:hypothetical protein